MTGGFSEDEMNTKLLLIFDQQNLSLANTNTSWLNLTLMNQLENSV